MSESIATAGFDSARWNRLAERFIEGTIERLILPGRSARASLSFTARACAVGVAFAVQAWDAHNPIRPTRPLRVAIRLSASEVGYGLAIGGSCLHLGALEGNAVLSEIGADAGVEVTCYTDDVDLLPDAPSGRLPRYVVGNLWEIDPTVRADIILVEVGDTDLLRPSPRALWGVFTQRRERSGIAVAFHETLSAPAQQRGPSPTTWAGLTDRLFEFHRALGGEAEEVCLAPHVSGRRHCLCPATLEILRDFNDVWRGLGLSLPFATSSRVSDESGEGVNLLCIGDTGRDAQRGITLPSGMPTYDEHFRLTALAALQKSIRAKK